MEHISIQHHIKLPALQMSAQRTVHVLEAYVAGVGGRDQVCSSVHRCELCEPQGAPRNPTVRLVTELHDRLRSSPTAAQSEQPAVLRSQRPAAVAGTASCTAAAAACLQLSLQRLNQVLLQALYGQPRAGRLLPHHIQRSLHLGRGRSGACASNKGQQQ